MLVQQFRILAVVRGLQWLGKRRALLFNHFNCHSHRLWDDEDVGEYDGGIDETGVPLNGLNREGGRDFRRATAFKEVTVTFSLVVLG